DGSSEGVDVRHALAAEPPDAALQAVEVAVERLGLPDGLVEVRLDDELGAVSGEVVVHGRTSAAWAVPPAALALTHGLELALSQLPREGVELVQLIIGQGT